VARNHHLAVYLYNQTPRQSLKWKSSYEAFHKVTMPVEGVSGPKKPTLNHLKAYGCRSYVLIKSAEDPDRPRKRQKLQPRAHIGYLVGYELTNIYRIWIPHKKKVISARDVLFDEEEFYDEKPIWFTDILISELDKAIAKVAIPLNRDLDDVQLREDDSDVEDAEDVDVKGLEPIRNDSDSPLYLTPEPTIESSFLTWNDLAMPVRSEGVKPVANLAVLPDRITPDLLGIPEYKPAMIDEIRQQNKDCF
jgi:hypothetical protein